MKAFTLWLMLVSLLFTTCKKKEDPTPLEQLPPATQEGKNTFGCLVNGQPWKPGRSRSMRPSLVLDVDPAYRGGYVKVLANWEEEGIDQHISISTDSVPKYREGVYNLKCIVNGPYTAGGSARFSDYIKLCSYHCQDDAQLTEATVTLTRYDLNARIVAGTFAFTLTKPGCDTIRVTDGRFDLTYSQ